MFDKYKVGCFICIYNQSLNYLKKKINGNDKLNQDPLNYLSVLFLFCSFLLSEIFISPDKKKCIVFIHYLYKKMRYQFLERVPFHFVIISTAYNEYAQT